MPLPLFAESLRRHADRVRDGIHHIVFSQDVMPVKVERCISENGAFSVCGLGAAFWSAIAQSLDSLRLPAWTADTLAGGAAARVDPPQKNLVRRSHRRLRVHSPTRSPADRDACRSFPDAGRAIEQLGRIGRRIVSRSNPSCDRSRAGRLPARTPIGGATARDLGGANGSRRRAAIRRCGIGDRRTRIARSTARTGCAAWDAAALLQWINWIWHDDDPLGEVAACERESAGASRRLTAAVLHLQAPERFPQWTDAAAAGLARIADAAADSYPMYVEGIAALCGRDRLHSFEVPPILARLTGISESPVSL